MVENGGWTEFLVVFYDGKREMDVGKVLIKPQLEYKPFQLMLAKKIGISPNHMSIYLLDQKQIPKSPFSEDRRRIPVTRKMNFHHVCHLKGCCFLVILKRSRRWRNRRLSVTNGVERRGILPEKEFHQDQAYMFPDKMVPLYNLMTPLKIDDLSRHVRSLKVEERENYPVTKSKRNVGSPTSALFPGLNVNFSPTIVRVCRSKSTPSPVKTNVRRDLKVFCADCWNAETNQVTTSFHPCINDTVITGFCTQFGPINYPNKSHA